MQTQYYYHEVQTVGQTNSECWKALRSLSLWPPPPIQTAMLRCCAASRFV